MSGWKSWLAGPCAVALALALLHGGVQAQTRRAATPDQAWAAPAPESAPAGQIPPSRVRRYVHDLTGVGALLGVAGGAAIDQASNTPGEWGGGLSGYAQRAASHAGALVVGETAHHGLAYALDETTQYERCRCTEFSLQAQHAFLGAVTGRDLRTGRRVVSVPRIAGAYAGAFAPMLWQPGYTAGNALLGGALTLVASGAFNLADELLHRPGALAAARSRR